MTKLLAWKELSYSILGDFRVYELIVTKIDHLSKRYEISTELTQALLITNSWDEDEVDEKMKDKNYLKSMYKFDSKEADERLAKYEDGQ